MAARKSAAKKAAKKTEPTVVEKATEAVMSLFSPNPEDPRPEAWRGILTAHALKQPTPRHLRVHSDDRFTGKIRRAQVDALTYIGLEPEDAASKILAAAMEEHRGEKNCDW